MPEFLSSDHAILDVGCGIGQTFASSKLQNGKFLADLDIDLECLTYGHRRFGYINFVNGTAENIPFRSLLFDMVISRVSLPYTNIPQSLVEIEQVTKKGGRVWFTLHPFSMVLKHLMRSICGFRIKDVVYRIYVIVNGLLFHFTGKQFAFPVNKKRYESFQTIAGMRRAMKRAGFGDICVERNGSHLVCTARKER